MGNGALVKSAALLVSALAATAVLAACGDSSGSDSDSSGCLADLAIGRDPALEFTDYDTARDTGMLGADDELAPFPDPDRDAPEAREVVMAYNDITLERDLQLPLVIGRSLTVLDGSPVGIGDVRCSIADPLGNTEALLLVPDADVDEGRWGGALEVDGDRMAVSADDDADLTEVLAPPSDDDSATDVGFRDVVSVLSARSAQQGQVFTTSGDASQGLVGVGEAMADGTRHLLIVWSFPDADPATVEAAFDEALGDTGAAEVLDIDAAEVATEDGMLVASIPIDSDHPLMPVLVARGDPLTRPADLP